MNYIPFGPSTNGPTRYKTSYKVLPRTEPLSNDTAVARGFATIAKEEKMRFSTLLKKIQREAMPRLFGKGDEPRNDTAYHETPHNKTRFRFWHDDTGQSWFQEVSRDGNYSIMTQAHKYTVPHEEAQ